MNNSNLIIHPIFPTLVLQDYYENNDNLLDIIKESWDDHCLDGNATDIYSSYSLHLDVRYEELFKKLNETVENFLNILEMDSDIFDINFTKSWFNALKTSQTPPHSHKDVNISVVYYAQTPPDCEQFLRLHDGNFFKEPFSGAFVNNSKIFNEFNSWYYNLFPKQGDIFVFPSGIVHDTVFQQSALSVQESPVNTLDDFISKRICIASDILLTYKEKQSKSFGIQPIRNWKTFSE